MFEKRKKKIYKKLKPKNTKKYLFKYKLFKRITKYFPIYVLV